MIKSYYRFVLNDEYIDYIKRIVSEEYKVKIDIEKSPNTFSRSYYLRIYNEESNISIRLSDHHTNLTKEGGGIRNYLITKEVTVAHVLEKMRQTIRRLEDKSRHNRIDKLFQEIERCL